MAMRPILKKLRAEIDNKLVSTKGEDWRRLLDGAAYDKSKQEGLRKYWRKHCVKLTPFTIPAGTRWVAKSSSGNCHGTIVESCKAIGLVNEVGYELLLDKPASLSDYCKDHGIGLDWDDDKVELASLSTELLEKIDEAIVR